MTREADKLDARAGRVRLPTPREDADPNFVFHANAVLEVKPTASVLPPLERHVADLIDGFRPVARVKKKSGLSSDELIDALRALRDRGLLVLTGIIEETIDVAPQVEDRVDATMPRGANDVIPPHVMREIEAMLDEEELMKQADAEPNDFEDQATTEHVLPKE